jgi:membrane-associated protease RseP (regulator of RpoE activity)
MESTAAPRNTQLHVGLFLATCVSTFGVFFTLFGGGVIGTVTEKVWGSVMYAGVVMLILLAHELGHYFMARAHGVDASLPYFIPFPLGFGTMGAVIRLRGRVPTRDALVDIGAAGPLAGLLIAVPVLFAGVWLSHVEQLPMASAVGDFPPTLSLLNFASMLGLWIKELAFGTPMPEWPQLQIFGDNLLTWFAVKLIHGDIPAGSEVMAHPVFIAAWFGLVVTMLNLLPVGQLDGGHLTHAWYGEKAEAIGHRIAAGALIMSLFFSASWLIWFFLITRFIGVGHPPVMEPAKPLSRGRKVVVVITWVMTGLTFMPMPISQR